LLVIVSTLTPEQQILRGAERVASQRAAARVARDHAALAAGHPRAGQGAAAFVQAPDGRPLPTEGWHWSYTHGGGLVAAAVHPAPVGVDVERIHERRAEVMARVVRENERVHLPEEAWFPRAWTAKEAVLKATTLGISGLGRCHIVSRWTPAPPMTPPEHASFNTTAQAFDEGLVVELDGTRWSVLQLQLENHVLAVTAADATATAWCIDSSAH